MTEDQPKSCKIDLSEKIQKVYMWASTLTSETIARNEDKYYATDLFKSLLYKIEHTKKGLVMLTGLQGTGKSRILLELSNRLPDCLRIKWVSNWQDKLSDDVYDRFLDQLDGEFEDQLDAWRRNGLNSGVVRKINRNNFNSIDVSSKKKILGRGRCNQLKKETLKMYLWQFKIFLIDMPDYSKSNANLMNGDIDELQQFWDELGQKDDALFVIAAQKELVMKNPHFFWGKCDRLTIEPLSSQELIDAYRLNTEDTQILDNDALKLLAMLSRGVFRRFKKYIRLAIERNLDAQMPLKPEHIDKAVTEKQKFEDMEAELADIFANQERRLCASRVLNFLRTNKDVNVKTIAEGNDISETMAQKIVQKLALYGYVTTKPGEGKEKLVELQL